VTITITSFGYGHDAPPPAHITLDVRSFFRDPHIDPELREMTGRDQRVIDSVMKQPRAHWTALHFADILRGLASVGVDVHLAIGCTGGKHRAPVLANVIAGHVGVAAQHRDIDKPVLPRRDGAR
jgi:UPF0042 nucleotide-binding protein